MAFKISKYKKEELEEKNANEEEKNVFENDSHGTISIHHVKDKVDEEGLSEGERRDRRIDKRIFELEKIGIKRGLQRKIFSIIGITFMFIVSLCCMYLCYILLSDIIDIVERADESVIQISDIETKKDNN